MNIVSRTILSIIEILCSIFGIQLIDYMKKTKFSVMKKIHTVIVLILIIAYSVYLSTENILFISKSYMRYVFYLIIIEENGVAMISVLTEFFMTFPTNDQISEKIYLIDKKMKLDSKINSQIKTNLGYLYVCYLIFIMVAINFDMVAWGYTFRSLMMSCKMKVFDFMLLKFITMTHFHLCRLCIMNDHLMKKLKSQRNYEKCNWLFDWKLYPKNMEFRHYVDNLDDFMFIYTSLCENMALISRKFGIFVCKNQLVN